MLGLFWRHGKVQAERAARHEMGEDEHQHGHQHEQDGPEHGKGQGDPAHVLRSMSRTPRVSTIIVAR
ncbi:hypothetical protein LP420_40750 [Massilia sp. B-10]|nr:hypothetical protein LP420_40750 [Massilia sp. B-10]